MERYNLKVRSVIALAVPATMACTLLACGSSGTSSAGSAKQTLPFDAKVAPPPSGAADVAAEFIAKIDELNSRMAARPFDIASQARTLGSDIGASFRFVRDHIRFEAYSGLLRGANGTLDAEAGNAIDRSVLLAALLAEAGTAARFATCQLPPDRAETLYNHIFDAVPNAADVWPKDPSGFLTRVVARARRDYPVIHSALGTYATAAASTRVQAIRDAQQHVWVQAKTGDGWQDLDTAFPDSKPGKSYCTPQQTVEAVPPDWYQRIIIRVMSERAEEGVLKVTTNLAVTVPAAELAGEAVFLTHIPGKAEGGSLSLGLGSVGSTGDSWAPALIIGGNIKAGNPIDFSDGGASGMADALGGGGESSVLVCEWVEFEIIRPDGRKDVVRRALFDRSTAAWRAAAAHDPAALRPLERNASGPLAVQAVHNLLFSSGPANLAAFGQGAKWTAETDQPPEDAPAAVALYPFAVRNFAALVWTDHVIIPAVNDRATIRLYNDSPRIVIVSAIPQSGNKLLEMYDLRRDWLVGLAADEASMSVVADRKLWFAALEGALEHEAVARDAASGDGDPTTVTSTSSLLGPDGVIALDSGDIGRLETLTPDPEKAARLRNALQGGRAVVPRHSLTSGPLGYWQISRSGDARAVLDEDLNSSIGLLNGGTYGLPRPPDPRGGTWTIPNSPGKQQRGKIELSRARPGDEYTIMILSVVNPSIVAVTALGVVIHQVNRIAAKSAYDAWNAAEQMKQDAALRAAGAR